MKLDVPYYSQNDDIADPYWQPRGCGISCVKMALDYFGADTPPLVQMAQTGEQEGGYSPVGWIHDYEVELFGRYGFSAHREEKMDGESGILKIYEYLLNGNPVIVSIEQPKSNNNVRFHQVLLVGFEEKDDETISGFFFHDPDRRNGGDPYRRISIEEFLKQWRKMAIFCRRRQGF